MDEGVEYNIQVLYDSMPGQYVGDYMPETAIRHGTGTVTYMDGTNYAGEWQNNFFNGEG
jgi:hypothetical protein